MTSLLLIVVGLAAGLGGGYTLRTKIMSSKNSDLLERSEKVLKEAENKANSMILEAKQDAIKMQEDLQAEEKQKRVELQKSEERLLKKESDLEEKIEKLEKKRDDLDHKIAEANELKSKAKEALDKQSEELERIAALSKEEAKEQLFKKIEEMYQEELVDHIKAIKKKAEAEADEKSKMILAQAMQKYAANQPHLFRKQLFHQALLLARLLHP
jgi:ribonuclease Y